MCVPPNEKKKIQGKIKGKSRRNKISRKEGGRRLCVIFGATFEKRAHNLDDGEVSLLLKIRKVSKVAYCTRAP